MEHENILKPGKVVFLWAGVLGAVGFLSGFLGPLILNPSANQGPLLGILITGPAGLVLGLLLGAVVSRRSWSKDRHIKALTFTSLVAMLMVLIGTVVSVQDRYLGSVVDIEIRGCQQAGALVSQRITWWKNKLQSNEWLKPRKGWEDEVKGLAQTDRGLVLEVKVLREKKIYRSNKPWNKGTLIAGRWSDSQEIKSYYSRLHEHACEKIGKGEQKRLFNQQEISKVLPPDILPTFLGLNVLSEVSPEYAALIPD